MVPTYVLVRDGEALAGLSYRLAAFIDQHFGPFIEKARSRNEWEGKGSPLSHGLQSLKNVHLDPRISGTPDLRGIRILSAISFIILFIAGINFVILSISRAGSRSLEVGMRKVIGARRMQIVR